MILLTKKNWLLLIAHTLILLVNCIYSIPSMITPQTKTIATTKKFSHKIPYDFNEAIAHYLNHINDMQEPLQKENETAAYKKELRYLFSHYERFSASTLLCRLRSAHQIMMQSNADNNALQKYEHICTALLLICANTILSEINQQLLQSLHEIDNLISYWRYQQAHPINYFFHKSPLKWVMGKEQSKEIAINLKRLHYKQQQLYKSLGTLTEHLHIFTQKELTYSGYYQWIQQLCVILSSLIKSQKIQMNPASLFDTLAAQLEFYSKTSYNVSYTCLASIHCAKKPSYVVRNWITSSIALGIFSYNMHHYFHNKDAIKKIITSTLSNVYENLTDLVIKPGKDIWHTIFGDIKSPISNTTATDFLTEINNLEKDYKINKKSAQKKKLNLDEDRAQIQKKMSDFLKKLIEEQYIIGKECFNEDKYNAIMQAELEGNINPFKSLIHDMDKYAVNDFVRKDHVANGLLIAAELIIHHQGSTFIQVVFDLIVDYGIVVVKELLIILAKSNKEWESACKKVNLILNIAVLTPTILVTGASGVSVYKLYQRFIKRHYSPIRMALTDVNALLIESDMQLNNHDYGKLLYLTYKLKRKAIVLKDPLAQEFLDDIAKIESKRYSAHIKRDIIHNMFNKYVFLGRVA